MAALSPLGGHPSIHFFRDAACAEPTRFAARNPVGVSLALGSMPSSAAPASVLLPFCNRFAKMRR